MRPSAQFFLNPTFWQKPVAGPAQAGLTSWTVPCVLQNSRHFTFSCLFVRFVMFPSPPAMDSKLR
jgi:hypothetical protein